MRITEADLTRIAIYLGHQKVWATPTKSGRRWEVGCECGWGARQKNGAPSITRATEKEAVLTVMWHLRKQAEDYIRAVRVNGGEIPAEALARV